MKYPFARDYSAHVVENIRVQWIHPIREMTDNTLFQLLLKNMLSKNDSIGKTAYLGAMDMVVHGKSEFILDSMRNGGAQALRKLFNDSNLLHNGWNGIGAGLNLVEAMLKCGENVRLYLLHNWSFLLRPLKRQFDIFGKIMSFNEFVPILFDKFHENNNLQGKVEADRIRDYCYRLKATKCKDPQKLLNGEDGVKFTDYLRRFEVICLTAHDITKDSIDLLFRANKRLDPTYLTLADTHATLPQKVAENVPGPRLNYQNLEEKYEMQKYKITSKYSDENLAIIADRNINHVLLSVVGALNLQKFVEPEVVRKDPEEVCPNSQKNKLSAKNLIMPIPNKMSVRRNSTKIELNDEQKANIILENVMTRISENYPTVIPEQNVEELVEQLFRTNNVSSEELIKTMTYNDSHSCELTSQENSTSKTKFGPSTNQNYKLTSTESSQLDGRAITSCAKDIQPLNLNAKHSDMFHEPVEKIEINSNSFLPTESSGCMKYGMRDMQAYTKLLSGKGAPPDTHRRRLRRRSQKNGRQDKTEIEDLEKCLNLNNICLNRSRYFIRENQNPKFQILFGRRYSSCSRQIGQKLYESSSSTVDCF